MQDSLAFAKIIKKLRSPDLIEDFIRNANDSLLSSFYRIVANLIHNTQFAENTLIRKKIPKLKRIMLPFRKKWMRVTKASNSSPREKRKFLLEQTGNGNVFSIISAILPVLLSLLWSKFSNVRRLYGVLILVSRSLVPSNFRSRGKEYNGYRVRDKRCFWVNFW